MGQELKKLRTYLSSNCAIRDASIPIHQSTVQPSTYQNPPLESTNRHASRTSRSSMIQRSRTLGYAWPSPCKPPFLKSLFWANREQHSDIDFTAGFYVLFGSGLMMSFILSVYILQSSKEKLTRKTEKIFSFHGWSVPSNETTAANMSAPQQLQSNPIQSLPN